MQIRKTFLSFCGMLLICAALAAILSPYAYLRGQTPVEETQPPKQKPRVDALGDPLPPGAIARLGTVRLRHGGYVNWMAFSPDGKMLYSNAGGWDDELRIWAVDSGKELHHYTIGNHARLSPDGKYLVSPADRNENDFFLWEARTGKRIRRFGFKRPTGSVSKDFRFSPDGRFLVSLDNDRDTMHLWEIKSGKEVWKTRTNNHPNENERRTDQVLYSPDGKTIASVTHKGQIRLWDAATGKSLHTMQGDLKRVVFSPDGKLLAAAKRHQGLRVWEVASGKLLHKWSRSQKSVCSLVFSPDSKRLATGDYNTIYILDMATGKELWKHTDRNAVEFLAFKDDRTLVAVQPNSRWIRVWDLVAGKKIHHIEIGLEIWPFNYAALSPDKKILALVGSGHAVHLFDLEKGQPLHRFPGSYHQLRSIAISPDGKQAAIPENTRNVALWNLATAKRVGSLPLKKIRHSLEMVRYLHDGKVVVLGTPDRGMVALEVATGKEFLYQKRDKQHYQCLALSEAGNRVLWKTENNSADIMVPHLLGRHRETEALEKKGDTSFLWVQSLPDGKEIYRVPRQKKGEYYKAVFSPDGTRLAIHGIGYSGISSNYLYNLRIFDLQTDREFPTIYNEHGFGDMTFSPDGRMLALQPKRGKVEIWEVATGTRRTRLENAVIAAEVLFSPDGKNLALATSDGSVQLWDMETGKELARLKGHRGWVTALCFTADSRRLISGSTDTTALVWDIARLRKNRPVVAKRNPTPKEIAKWWRDLGDKDATVAYKALRHLAAADRQTLALLQRHLKPAKGASKEYIIKLIRKMNSDRFPVRQTAMIELQKLGQTAKVELQKAVKKSPSVEVKVRARSIIEKLEKRANPELLQTWRAIEILEKIGESGIPLLERMSRGTPQALATEEARAALRRLRRMSF